jgi:hypothetical protein
VEQQSENEIQSRIVELRIVWRRLKNQLPEQRIASIHYRR